VRPSDHHRGGRDSSTLQAVKEIDRTDLDNIVGQIHGERPRHR